MMEGYNDYFRAAIEEAGEGNRDRYQGGGIRCMDAPWPPTRTRVQSNAPLPGGRIQLHQQFVAVAARTADLTVK